MAIHIYRSNLEYDRWFKMRDTKTDFEYYAKCMPEVRKYGWREDEDFILKQERLVVIRNDFCSSGETFSEELIFPLLHTWHLLVQQRNWEVEYLSSDQNSIVEERFRNSTYAKI